jgi:23S rRNA pseudouridine2605 synthase
LIIFCTFAKQKKNLTKKIIMYKKSAPISKGKKYVSKEKKTFGKPRFEGEKPTFDKEKKKFGAKSYKKTVFETPKKTAPKKASVADGIRLNKYIANAGICSRREADTLIESGAVRINGVICTQLGTRVMPDDKVEFGGETLVSEKKVYLLMNKPKGYITTTDDPQERKTVMHLIDGACKERIYPVGRLDRQTTGVLLFTNDGEMAKRLTHPSHGARKIYHVTLDKNITKIDLQTIAKGVELEDGFVHVDEINLIVGTKNEIGIQLHSGMNRVVRRVFEKFDYKVTKLDRVLFAELTKKDLSRGHWRMLGDKEVAFLKMK